MVICIAQLFSEFMASEAEAGGWPKRDSEVYSAISAAFKAQTPSACRTIISIICCTRERWILSSVSRICSVNYISLKSFCGLASVGFLLELAANIKQISFWATRLCVCVLVVVCCDAMLMAVMTTEIDAFWMQLMMPRFENLKTNVSKRFLVWNIKHQWS